MYLPDETSRTRQQELLADATAARHALHARALGRATRRVERAERRLTRSRERAMRLRTELAAGH